MDRVDDVILDKVEDDDFVLPKKPRLKRVANRFHLLLIDSFPTDKNKQVRKGHSGKASSNDNMPPKECDM